MDAQIPKPGELVAGKLLVERVLGSGGMGVVLAARHVELGERVAIKMLRVPGTADGRAIERLRREARAAAKLRGEHVVRVMDVGTLENGAPYILMEFVAGRTLAQTREATGRVPVSTAVDWILQACEGLAEAHGHGVVHRDIKPSNLLLTKRPDGSPLIKLLDFGIAKSLTAAHSTLTETSGFLGSPLYASPEQVRDGRRLDHRTDIWSLGVVLYELCTGKLPFPSYTASGALASLVADPPVAPRTVVPELPAALERVLLRCLEKQPEQRYADVAQLARALEPFGTEASRGATERVQRILNQAGKVEPELPDGIDEPGPRSGTQDAPLAASLTAAPLFDAPVRPPRALERLKRWWPILGAALLLGLGGWARSQKPPAGVRDAPVPAAVATLAPIAEPAAPSVAPPLVVTASVATPVSAPKPKPARSLKPPPPPKLSGVLEGEEDFGPRK
jgi:eukaryotic-like serine/threonine-protein kinase